MSKNTGSENFAQELAALPRALESISLSPTGNAVILARLVRGISSEHWQEVSQAYSLNQWQALPVPMGGDDSEVTETLQADASHVLAVTPFREVNGALTKTMFMRLLQRELVRLSRNGGCMSLVAATLSDRRSVTTALGENAVKRLDALLGATLLERLDACDAVGMTRRGVFVCSLPGMGQMATRHFAETCQKAFREAARPFFPAGGLGAGLGGECALGIVNVLQGESCTVPDILKRCSSTLEAALRKRETRIHQESTLAPFEGTTLVQSNEKRFLFFGGDPA